MSTKHEIEVCTNPDCGCKGTLMELNGLRFACAWGTTLECHADDHPVYYAAPAMFEALKEIQGQLSRYGDWDDGCFYLNGRATPELEHGMRLATAALAQAEPATPVQ